MTDLLIRGGRLLLPSRSLDETADLLVRGGRVMKIGRKIAAPKKCVVIDAAGLWVAPGLVDIHTHLREPGFEYKETIASGTAAAAAGGFTSILCMANTNPVNDTAAVTRYILRKAKEAGTVKVHPVGAITTGLAGEGLTEMLDLTEAGCVAFSNDGKTVMNAQIMRKALEYASLTGRPLIAHSEDDTLANGGSCHEGRISCLTGLRGIPSEAEEVIVARDVILAHETRHPVHVAHVSSRGTVAILAAARAAGTPVSAEVTPHHLFLTEEAVRNYDTNAKVSPPLRAEEDRRALIEALRSGVIDCIASDHAPHGTVDKEIEFDAAAFGISGLETSLGLCLGLVHEKLLTPLELVARMSTVPARIVNIAAGDLTEGRAADIVLIDPEHRWTVDPASFVSRGRNTPFAGRELRGRALLTLVDGSLVYRHASGAERVAEPTA